MVLVAICQALPTILVILSPLPRIQQQRDQSCRKLLLSLLCYFNSRNTRHRKKDLHQSSSKYGRERLSDLMQGLSSEVNTVPRAIRHLESNFLAFKDSPGYPLGRSPLKSCPNTIFCCFGQFAVLLLQTLSLDFDQCQ